MKPPEIRDRLRKSGRPDAALMRHLGISRDAMSRRMSGRTPFKADEVDKIRDFFAEEDSPPSAQFQQIPVYGYAAAGDEDRVALASDRELDRIEVPIGLTRGESFAVRIAGDSMEPRLFGGELVIVGRGVRPAKYGDCVVELTDQTAVVKQYIAMRDGWLFLHQWNPDEEVRIEQSKVRAIHAVLYRR